MPKLRNSGRPPKPALENLMNHVSPEPMSGCWLWLSGVERGGYGRFEVKSGNGHRNGYAHRVAYELLVGPIPDGLQLDHICRTRCCVNPRHLEPVTCQQNIQRGWRSRRLPRSLRIFQNFTLEQQQTVLLRMERLVVERERDEKRAAKASEKEAV